MAAGKTTGARRWQATVVTGMISVLIVNGLIGVCTGSAPIASVVSWHLAGYSQPRLVYLQPGLRIKNKAPQDWSHLVIKSLPRLVSGDRGSLPAGSSKTATMFRNVLLANVKPVDMNEKDFELTQVGLGICVPDPQDEDQDIVVTADRLEALGLDHLSMVQRMVLDAAEVEMAEGRIIARTPTFALFRAPITMIDTGGKHSKFNIHYAFCVEHTTGKLHVGVWALRPPSEPQQAPTTIVRLSSSNPMFPCELDVKARRILGTVPFSWSFAVRTLPPGDRLRVPPSLGRLILDTTRRPASFTDELERQLVKLLKPAEESNVAGNKSTMPGIGDSKPTAPNVADDKPITPRVDRSVRRTAIPPHYQRLP